MLVEPQLFTILPDNNVLVKRKELDLLLSPPSPNRSQEYFISRVFLVKDKTTGYCTNEIYSLILVLFSSEHQVINHNGFVTSGSMCTTTAFSPNINKWITPPSGLFHSRALTIADHVSNNRADPATPGSVVISKSDSVPSNNKNYIKPFGVISLSDLAIDTDTWSIHGSN